MTTPFYDTDELDPYDDDEVDGQQEAQEEPDPDPYQGNPWGEQQAQVDWLESRYDDDYAGENDYYDDDDEPPF